MEYFTKKVRVDGEEGLQVWCTSHGYSRPADGEKVYPSRQNAYVAKDRFWDSVTWQDCKVTVRMERQHFQRVVEHIEKHFRGVDLVVCLPYKDAFFEKKELPVVDIVFRFMCRPPQVHILDQKNWQPSPMTYEELVAWLKELDTTFPVVQRSRVEL